MKIVFCIKKLAGISGGAERVLAAVANGLSRRGHDVYVLSFDAEGQQPFYDFSSSVHLVNLGEGKSGLLSGMTQFVRMKRAAAHLKPDVVFGFLASTYVALSVLFYFSGVKFVACEHINREWYKGRLVKYCLVNFAGNISSRISFLSDEIANDYRLIRPRQKLTLHNPVRVMSKVAKVMASSKSNFTILNVGRLVAFKDQKTLIEAFYRIHTDFPEWRLRIIGQGELKAAILAQIERLGIGNIVEVLDISDDIEEEYARADLFVIASSFEGFGLVTAEASSAGLPCIGFSDCEGTNKIIKHGINGVLVTSDGDRVGALAASMKALLKNKKELRRLGKNGLSRPVSYEIDNVLDNWEEIIVSVVNGKSL